MERGSGVEVASAGRIVVPAREGRGVRLNAGDRFKCVDLEGHQCGDLFAFNAADIREYASTEHTRVMHNRLFPRVGETFVTNKRESILYFEADDTPGKHDMLIAACDPTRFALLGVEGWHPSCQENLQKVMEGFGFSDIEIPSPINIFTNLPVGEDGTLRWEPALTEADDSITLRAQMDCLVVLTACSQDILPINDKNPTALAIDVLD